MKRTLKAVLLFGSVYLICGSIMFLWKYIKYETFTGSVISLAITTIGFPITVCGFACTEYTFLTGIFGLIGWIWNFYVIYKHAKVISLPEMAIYTFAYLALYYLVVIHINSLNFAYQERNKKYKI